MKRYHDGYQYRELRRGIWLSDPVLQRRAGPTLSQVLWGTMGIAGWVVALMMSVLWHAAR